MSQTMDKSISINYAEKKRAMLEASNVMEHALKTIADLFKTIEMSNLVHRSNYKVKSALNDNYKYIQAANLSLIDDNKRLQLSMRESSEQKNECTVCRKKTIPEGELLNCSETVQERKKENFVDTCHDAATQGIIESTQIEERVLVKPRSRLLDKRSNFVCDENKLNKLSTPISTQPKRKKQSHLAKVSAEIVILTSSKTPYRDMNILQSVDEKTDGIIHNKNNAELDPEYLDIDATLFEQPFSQEQSPDKKAPTSCEVDQTETLTENLKKTPAKSFLDDIVEVSPKKDVLRKKHWLRHNRHTVKSCLINPSSDLAGTSNADSNDKNSCLQKALKYKTPKDENDITATKILTRTQSIEQSSDETYFAADETYFAPVHDIPPKANCNKTYGEILNKAKRKLSDTSISSDTEKNIDPTSELEIDIGNMSDWDTDISSEKLSSSTTPQKRALISSFDIVAVKQVVPKFATKGPVVRNKLERAKLRGWDCENCARYYENIGLSEKELAERKNRCSRHRSKFNERYHTPPGFWDIRFPETQNSSPE